ncbi:dockerin type I domain-containing protein [Anaerobaca lacustris]|uniref:Dockerin type I domain-containing protein n=1 Tax=Anaerobaca lacustris TaxID=3044600 RepID=A0AAW6U139_9BACT|nr:dockerin type I domain-containing protein [Sedimentisphaerales bacterium M17dextr]
MRRADNILMYMACLLGAVLVQQPRAVVASETMAAVKAAMGRLILGQLQSGPLEGAWAGEEEYTGSIVVGLVDAYAMTCDEDARVAAVAGGNFILRTAAGNYYGDEAYALMCLSQMSPEGPLSVWQVALEDFYRKVSERPQNGTRGYIAQFDRTDPSIAVFYLAHHTVAAFHVDAEDKDIWREALVDHLIRVDDDSATSAVMALGTATWAFATTGWWDDALLDPNGEGASCWQARTFDGLAELLLTHRIVEGDLAGSFYWRFDHSPVAGGPPGGYTEEMVSSALGLTAGGLLDGDPEVVWASRELRDLLVGSIAADGSVRQHLTLGGQAYYSEIGRVLQALAGLTNAADFNLDGRVDGSDLAILAARWNEAGGNCADRNRDGRIDARDLMVLVDNWLTHARHDEAVVF